MFCAGGGEYYLIACPPPSLGKGATPMLAEQACKKGQSLQKNSLTLRTYSSHAHYVRCTIEHLNMVFTNLYTYESYSFYSC